jgi:outer membrane protein assembly factor BamB
VRCHALKDGKLLWEKEPFKGKPASTIHIKNSLASETPAVDGKCVVALFGNTGVAAYDHDGKELWKETLPAYKTSMGWGTASSPALHDGVLYLQNEN